MAGEKFDSKEAVETITSWPPSEAQCDTAKELLQYLIENKPAQPSGSPQGRWAIAIDGSAEPVLEVLSAMLPPEMRSRTTCRVCNHLGEVVTLLREEPRDLLVIHSNLFVVPGTEAISALVAVSPGTRYLVVTAIRAWPAEFQRVSALLRLPLVTLLMPFSGEQFLAALQRLATIER